MNTFQGRCEDRVGGPPRMQSGSSVWPVLAIGLGVGVAATAIAVWLWGGDPVAGGHPESPAASASAASPGSSADTRLRAELEGLRRALDEERSARGALALELQALRVDFERAQGAPPPHRAGAAADAMAPSPADASSGSPGRSVREAGPHEGMSKPWFDGAALAASGVPAAEVERLRDLWEEVELEKLYLRDEAAREGRPAARRRIRELDAELRAELGETGYDRLLYATGRANRVMIGDVLSNSPADDAGLQPGDIVVRYAGERVFAPTELQEATRGGEAGERVRVEVLREDLTLSFSLLRGPLGVRLQGERSAPEGS